VGPRECQCTLRLCAESRFLVSGSDDGRLDLWEFSATEDAALANLHSAVAHDDIITDVATSHEAPTVASSSRDCRHRPRTLQLHPRPSERTLRQAPRLPACLWAPVRLPACCAASQTPGAPSLQTGSSGPWGMRHTGMRLPH